MLDLLNFSSLSNKPFFPQLFVSLIDRFSLIVREKRFHHSCRDVSFTHRLVLRTGSADQSR